MSIRQFDTTCLSHQFEVEQQGAALSRLVCSSCGVVRIEQAINRDFKVVWTTSDYEIASQFHRELVS